MSVVEQILAADRATLVERWQSLFDREPPAHVQVNLIRRILSWHAQDQMLDNDWCGPKGAARLERVLRPGSSRPATPSLAPGTRLLREWQGVTHEVLVLPQGFAHRDKTYKSLSAVAKAITGTHWSGPVFFGVRR
jgi:Protein of unknown function (DUF2924)